MDVGEDSMKGEQKIKQNKASSTISSSWETKDSDAPLSRNEKVFQIPLTKLP